MDTNIIMLSIAVGALIVGCFSGLGFNYLVQNGKEPKATLTTANTVINVLRQQWRYR